jgi:hypothetical protein
MAVTNLLGMQSCNKADSAIKLHCKFGRVVLTPRGHFRPFEKTVVSTPRQGRFNSKGSFDTMEGSK